MKYSEVLSIVILIIAILEIVTTSEILDSDPILSILNFLSFLVVFGIIAYLIDKNEHKGEGVINPK